MMKLSDLADYLPDPTQAVGGAVVQRVGTGSWTCDQQAVGSNPTRGKSCVTFA